MANGLFRGAQLARVVADGRTRLPAFVVRALGEDAGELIFGLHERALCLTGYDGAFELRLAEDLERRRLRDEERGAEPVLHEARLRRAFGFAEGAQVDRDGACRLPARLRRRGRIGGLALFVGTGGSFEIWNPSLALEAGDEVLRGLAANMLAQGAGEAREENE